MTLARSIASDCENEMFCGLPLYNQSDIDRLSSLLNKYHQQELLQLLQLVQDYQKRLGSNVNTQLCLEGFLIRINNYLEE